MIIDPTLNIAHSVSGNTLWTEIKGFERIAYMTEGAFLFDHELGQCWLPKSTVKFERELNSTKDNPEYKIFIATWFDWPSKIKMMKEGKLVSDEYLESKLNIEPIPAPVVVSRMPKIKTLKKLTPTKEKFIVDISEDGIPIYQSQDNMLEKSINDDIRKARQSLTLNKLNLSIKLVQIDFDVILNLINQKKRSNFETSFWEKVFSSRSKRSKKSFEIYPTLLDKIESTEREMWLTIDPFDRKMVIKKFKKLLIEKILMGGKLTKFERNINTRISSITENKKSEQNWPGNKKKTESKKINLNRAIDL